MSVSIDWNEFRLQCSASSSCDESSERIRGANTVSIRRVLVKVRFANDAVADNLGAA